MLNTLKKLFAKDKQIDADINTDNLEKNIIKQPVNFDDIKDQHKINSNNTNPYLNNKIHLDYQLERLVLDNKNLKNQRLILSSFLLISIIGLIYLGGQTKKEAVITLVDEKGQRVQPINLREMKDGDQRNRIIFKIIEESLLNIRTVTPDKNLQFELGKKALINIRKGSQAYKLVVDYLNEDNPNSPYNLGQKYTVTPIIKSVTTENIMFNGEKTKRASLVIEWRERVNKLDGTYIQTNEYKGNFIFDIIPPENDEDIRQNPFGIQIYNMQLVPVRIVDKANDSQPINSNSATTQIPASNTQGGTNE